MEVVRREMADSRGAFDTHQTRIDVMKMHMFLCCLSEKMSENP